MRTLPAYRRRGAAKHVPLDGLLGCNGLVDEELGRQLLARRQEDQRIRYLAAARADQDTGRLPDDLGEQWQRIDDDNTRWLADLLASRGWPGRTLVGEEAAQAAWLLAQHADRDPIRQHAFLYALRAAVTQGERLPRRRASSGRLDGRSSNPTPENRGHISLHETRGGSSRPPQTGGGSAYGPYVCQRGGCTWRRVDRHGVGAPYPV